MTISSKILNRILLYSFIGFILFSGSCRRPPDYSDTPFIVYQDIERVSGALFAVTFYFEDGNADLGLGNSGSDIAPPLNPSFYIVADKSNPCMYKDTIPVPELSQDQAFTDSIVRTIDNPTGNNIVLSLLVKSGEDFIPRFYGLSSNCGITDTINHPQIRFPRITESLNDEVVDGTIRFEIDLDFTPTLSTDTLMLEFFIYDRALNQSNTIRTIPFPKSIQ